MISGIGGRNEGRFAFVAELQSINLKHAEGVGDGYEVSQVHQVVQHKIVRHFAWGRLGLVLFCLLLVKKEFMYCILCAIVLQLSIQLVGTHNLQFGQFGPPEL